MENAFTHDVKQTKIYANSYMQLLRNLSVWIDAHEESLIQSIYICENGYYSGEGSEMVAIIYWNV